MKFLIQQNLIFDKTLDKIESATKEYDRDFISLIPYSEEIISNNSINGIDYIPYGSSRLLELAHKLNWKGVHYNPETFNYESAKLNRFDMLNDLFIMNIKEAITFFEYNLDQNRKWFIRPNEVFKYFSGIVMTAKEAANFLADALNCQSEGTYRLKDDLEIVISNPVKIDIEWRYFIIGGKIISGSVYMKDGKFLSERVIDKPTLREAQMLADRWLPNDCVVMDVALVEGELKVIEFNCINCSGFYDHDIDLIFKEWYNYYLECGF